MESFLFLFIHYGLPIVLILYTALRKYNSKLGLVITTGFSVAFIFFLYLWGQWAMVGSYYVRYFMIIAIIIFIYFYITKSKSLVSDKSINLLIKIRVVLTGLFTLLLLFFCINILFSNNNYKYDSVPLDFPLKGGEFYIASGGTHSLMNGHLRNYESAQQYALDINKLSSFKSVSKGILSKENNKHYIFSDTVYCPCDGVVQKESNNVADNVSSSMDVSSKNGAGNFVYLKCDSIYVYLLHLKKGIILVSKGQEVQRGLPLALVGNSGFSQEPHLHVQASKYNSDSTLVGVPIKFGGRILSKNDIYEN